MLIGHFSNSEIIYLLTPTHTLDLTTVNFVFPVVNSPSFFLFIDSHDDTFLFKN